MFLKLVTENHYHSVNDVIVSGETYLNRESRVTLPHDVYLSLVKNGMKVDSLADITSYEFGDPVYRVRITKIYNQGPAIQIKHPAY